MSRHSVINGMRQPTQTRLVSDLFLRRMSYRACVPLSHQETPNCHIDLVTPRSEFSLLPPDDTVPSTSNLLI